MASFCVTHESLILQTLAYWMGTEMSSLKTDSFNRYAQVVRQPSLIQTEQSL